MSEPSVFDQLINIHQWASYSPGIRQYVEYPTNVLFASIKIVDIYSVLCVARSNLLFSSSENMGDLVDANEPSRIYARSIFIQNSLIYYNIAVDQFWQYLWLFYNNTMTDKLPTNSLYQECLKGCTYEELLSVLTLGQDIKMREMVTDFFAHNHYYNRIRPMYNYLKHRATYHFQGLGINPPKQPFSFNIIGPKDALAAHGLSGGDGDNEIPRISQKELSIPEWTELFYNFDHDFVEYLNNIFNVTMPFDYNTSNEASLMQVLQYYTLHWEEIVEYNKRL